MRRRRAAATTVSRRRPTTALALPSLTLRTLAISCIVGRMTKLDGGTKLGRDEAVAEEYLPNRGVFLAQVLGKARGHAFGFYRGRMEPGCAIAREIHPETSETVYILRGRAMGLVGEREVELGPGDVLHVEANVHHGLRNAGDDELEFLVIGHPDF
jgi:quercetin dioxygenase-like cupin family protein